MRTGPWGAVRCGRHSTGCPGLRRGQLLEVAGSPVVLHNLEFSFSTADSKAWHSVYILGPGHRIAQDLPSDEKSLVRRDSKATASGPQPRSAPSWQRAATGLPLYVGHLLSYKMQRTEAIPVVANVSWVSGWKLCLSSHHAWPGARKPLSPFLPSSSGLRRPGTWQRWQTQPALGCPEERAERKPTRQHRKKGTGGGWGQCAIRESRGRPGRGLGQQEHRGRSWLSPEGWGGAGCFGPGDGLGEGLRTWQAQRSPRPLLETV